MAKLPIPPHKRFVLGIIGTRPNSAMEERNFFYTGNDKLDLIIFVRYGSRFLQKIDIGSTNRVCTP
jgi:hypothetical protein